MKNDPHWKNSAGYLDGITGAGLDIETLVKNLQEEVDVIYNSDIFQLKERCKKLLNNSFFVTYTNLYGRYRI
jgi:hypothetical protein